MRRITTLLAGATLALGPLTGAGTAQATPTAPDVTATAGWACSVPWGRTYTRVANQLSVCSPGNFAYSYYLDEPRNGLMACNVPPGYTYSSVSNQLSVCNPGNFAYSYQLQQPRAGLWACEVPPGFSYSRVANQLSVCSPGNFAYSYLLS